MKTIKLPYKSNSNFDDIQRQYNSVLHFAFNRLLENKTQIEIRLLFKNLNNIEKLDSWLLQCALMEAIQIKTQNTDEKTKETKNIIFGGKSNFFNRLKNKISKEEYKKKRLNPISIQGEETKQGNRKFKLDIIENNQIIFKLNKNEKFELKLPKLRNNIKKELEHLQILNEIPNGKKGYTYSIKLDSKYIYISFEEFKNKEKLILDETKFLGIDLNPSDIGVSIQNSKYEIERCFHFDLSKIVNEIISLKSNSSNKEFKRLNNKLNFETIEIAKKISILAKEHKCKFVFIEELKFKTGVENKYNKTGNRKIKNLWKKDKYIQNLKKRLNILGIVLYEINPAYSSYIGNLKYNYSDPVNSSIEIGRRGFDIIINKNKKFYPDLDKETLKDHWKEYFKEEFKTWKEFCLNIKNSKLKYRVSLNESKEFKVFRFSSYKSNINLYSFI